MMNGILLTRCWGSILEFICELGLIDIKISVSSSLRIDRIHALSEKRRCDKGVFS